MDCLHASRAPADHSSGFPRGAISPGGELPGLPADASGAVVTLSENPDGQLGYAFPHRRDRRIDCRRRLPTPEAEVGRLHRAGLRVLGIFRVQCTDDVYRADPAAAVLRRGVELSLDLCGTGRRR